MEIFEKLSLINVNDKTEKKGKFTYLSWSFAWSELKKISPSATSKVYHDENTNMPYFASKAGVIVKVGITIDGLEHINYLPVMDFRNASIPLDKVNMMDINKAIQRCTVKAIALHGLGLYIYAGEDLPEEIVKTPSEKLKECKTQDELKTVFFSLTRTEQTAMANLKDELKLKLK
jgi:hypothetical protein